MCFYYIPNFVLKCNLSLKCIRFMEEHHSRKGCWQPDLCLSVLTGDELPRRYFFVGTVHHKSLTYPDRSHTYCQDRFRVHPLSFDELLLGFN